MVSDYWAVPFLATMHRVAADTDEAGALALAAGIDVELPDTIGFGAGLVERVRRGELPEDLVDRAARRLLTQKVQLGLLDPDWTPEGSVAGAAAVDLDSPANRALAREMAERSVVLLDAGTALPLLGDGRPALRRVAVVGPCAADPRTFMGCYAFPNHVLPRHPGLGLGHRGADRGRCAARPSCQASRSSTSRAARCRARTGPASRPRSPRPARPTCAWPSSATSPACSGAATSGEGCDAEDLRLPGRAGGSAGRAPADRHAGGRGRGLRPPLRPRRRARPRRRPGAGVHAGRGGSGRRSPASCPAGSSRAGSCPCRSRKRPGGQPSTYLQPPLGSPESAGISTLDPTPLFPFGYGGSYTTFEVDDLRISDAEVPTDGEFTVSVRVRNTGPRAGDEVVQLYLHDVVAQVARPVKQLAGFARVGLAPGEGVDVRFRVHADRTAYTEPGARADRRAGGHRGDGRDVGGGPALPRSVRLTGPLRVVGHDRQLVTPVELGPAAGDAQRRRREGDTVPSRDRRATLANVAASAGVSVATVSKVLNGRNDVAPATRALVQDLLHEHDYVARRVRPAPARPTIELLFHGQLNAYSHRGVAGRRGGRGEAGVAVVVSVRPRGRPAAGAEPSGRVGP